MNEHKQADVEEESESEAERSLAREVAALRESAVTSSDPVVVAKAVAVSDLGVQQLILERIAASERLAEVFVLQGATASEMQVFFRFDADSDIHLTDTGVLAFVDSVKGEVSGTIYPFTLHRERRVARPFVTVTALQATAATFAASERAIGPLVERERAFFRSLGLDQLARGRLGVTTDTVCDTSTTSTTWSGVPYRPDQTDPETTNDYCDSQGPIIA